MDSEYSNYAVLLRIVAHKLARVHRVSRAAFVRKRNLRSVTNATQWKYFGFLDWNIYFQEGFNY